jgi:threonine/homoserine/homoserine lactone efflux protein
LLNLYPFLVYVVVTTFTPGPNNIMSMTNAMHDGYVRTLKFIAGMVTGFFVVMLASGLLNVLLTGWLPALETWLKYLGALYMFYLAWHIARSRPIELDSAENSDNTFKAGFGMQFLNIKVILYGITVYSLFIVHAYHSPLLIGLFAVLLSLVGFVSVTCWGLGGNLFRLPLRKHYRLFNYLMAALLLYTAISSLLPAR